jgi:hypothetical protein
MARDELKDVIDRTQFAISTEETRYYLNGIYVHAKKEGASNVLRVVAPTDTVWLALNLRCRRVLRISPALSFRAKPLLKSEN